MKRKTKEEEKPKILGIIPVRGGSRSVPRKNIKPLGGKPLLYYVLKEALKSKHLTKVIVSSEDDEILSIAKKYSDESVILKRPKSLAKDSTPDVPVLHDVTKKIEKKVGYKFDYIVMLHATAPFVTHGDIDGTIGLLLSSKTADSSVSVYQVNDLHPMKMKRIVNGELVSYIKGVKETSTANRQDFVPVYKRNTAIYAAKRDVVIKRRKVWGRKVLPYIVPNERSIDINTITDFFVAEAIMKYLKSKNSKGRKKTKKRP